MRVPREGIMAYTARMKLNALGRICREAAEHTQLSVFIATCLHLHLFSHKFLPYEMSHGCARLRRTTSTHAVHICALLGHALHVCNGALCPATLPHDISYGCAHIRRNTSTHTVLLFAFLWPRVSRIVPKHSVSHCSSLVAECLQT